MPADPSSPVEELIPEHPTLERLRESAANCRGCGLWRNATQTVFGEGHSHADVVMVGEQPGDVEDRTGRPFAGPAGKLLDRALEEAGIDRREVYVTNAVKHFKWTRRGKLRLHKKPSSEEIRACRPWLDAELEVLEPRVLVCLGATAVIAAEDIRRPPLGHFTRPPEDAVGNASPSRPGGTLLPCPSFPRSSRSGASSTRRSADARSSRSGPTCSAASSSRSGWPATPCSPSAAAANS